MRLACQLRPTADIAVFPLLPADDARALQQRETRLPSEERFIAVLVIDMRNSTRLAETRLPFDAVFIIDRFVAAVDAAISEAGGRSHLFTGDGLIATFGLRCPPEEACRGALRALVLAARNLEALNELLGREIAEPIRFGAGVHASAAVVGEVGYGAVRLMTTLGDPANVAARLETLCKTWNCQAVISEDVRRLAGLAPGGLPRHQTELRGRGPPLSVCAVREIAELAGLFAGEERPVRQ